MNEIYKGSSLHPSQYLISYFFLETSAGTRVLASSINLSPLPLSHPLFIFQKCVQMTSRKMESMYFSLSHILRTAKTYQHYIQNKQKKTPQGRARRQTVEAQVATQCDFFSPAPQTWS